MGALRICVLAAAIAIPRLGVGEEAVGVLAVAPPPGPSPGLVEVTIQLRHALAERLPGVLLGQRLRERMKPDGAWLSPADVDRTLASAVRARVEGDYEGAARTLRALVADLDARPQDEKTLQRWTEAMTRLAKIESDLGHGDAARAVLEDLVRAVPDVKVDRAQYPPSFDRQVTEARARVHAAPARTLTVTASGPGARVYVGGRDAGVAPVAVKLPAGRHRVRGVLGPHRVSLPPVDLANGDASVFLDFAVPEALRPDGGPGLALLERDRARRLASAAAFLGLDRVIAATLASARGGEFVVASLHDTRSGKLEREARVRLSGNAVPLGGISALAEFLATGKTPSPLVEIRFPAPPAAPAPPPPPREMDGAGGEKLVEGRLKHAVELRDRSGAFVTYVDRGDEVRAAEKPTKGSRFVVLTDGREGFVPASAVELGPPRPPSAKPEPPPREPAPDPAARAARPPQPAPPAKPAARPFSLQKPVDAGPNGEALVPGRLRQAAELKTAPNGAFMRYVDRGEEVWTADSPVRGHRLVVLSDGQAGYVPAKIVEVLKVDVRQGR